MKKYYYLRNILFGLPFIIILTGAITSASGPGGGYTNAPGESNCTSCHSGTLVTSGSNLNNLRLGSKFQGNGYIPDSTYVMELTYKQTGISKFGFEVTVLDANDTKVGTLTSINNRTSKTTATISGKTREYIQHTNTGTSNVGTDSTRWTFEWKAPSKNIGDVTFYVVVNATNSNNNTSGDAIYAKTFKVSPSTLLSVAKASSNDTVTCLSYDVQLNGSGTANPTSYSWKLTGGIPSTSSSQNPTVVYNSPGTKQAILTVKNQYGTSEPDTLDVVVNLTPSALVLNGAAGSVCKGDSLLLTANFAGAVTYQWQHNNSSSRAVYVKDTGDYSVKVTSMSNGCFRVSKPFNLSHYDNPSISITKSSTTDTICGAYSETFTASGTLVDSVHWYVNGVLARRTNTLTTVFTGSNPIQVRAIAKSADGCLSDTSNMLNLVSIPKIFPSNFINTKTTSSIDMRWKKSAGILQYLYNVDNGSFTSTTSDSTLSLSGLQPNTSYKITIRSTQNAPCGATDTSFTIKTNACSNLSYFVDFETRSCKGASLTATVNNLYNAIYSVSFNNGAFSRDTIYMFNPTSSDTLRILIVDSLSPTCPAIIENIGYTIDTLIDKDTASTAKNISACVNTYEMILPSGYATYEFYKNAVLETSSSSNAYNYTGLTDGDVLTAIGKLNTCSRSFGPVNLTINTPADAGFSFTRNWKEYTFTADLTGQAIYKWTTGADDLGNAANFTKDMSAYNNSSIDVKLYTETSAGCTDSTTQSLVVPNFTSIQGVNTENLKVYPNPFGDQIHIDTDMSGYGIQIIDQLGKVIYRNTSMQTKNTIQTDVWSKGIYHILINDTTGKVINFSFIKA
jgi:hypothetical protein